MAGISLRSRCGVWAPGDRFLSGPSGEYSDMVMHNITTLGDLGGLIMRKAVSSALSQREAELIERYLQDQRDLGD